MFKKREICVVFGLAALLAAVAYINHEDQSYKFDSLTQQHKASYCAGVYEYGKTYATDREQKYTFTKATEWFEERAAAPRRHEEHFARSCQDRPGSPARFGQCFGL